MLIAFRRCLVTHAVAMTMVIIVAWIPGLTNHALAGDRNPKAGMKSSGSGDGGIAGSQPCAAQCASDIIADGFTNIDDLLAVVNGWGYCLTCPQTFCSGDVNHDCWTNVDDLLAVINGWGPCPAPNNDSCANPESLYWGEDYVFCTAYATTDGAAEAGCAFCCGDLQIHKDIWYTVLTNQFGGDYWGIIDTCGSGFDTKIAVYRFNGVNGCNCANLAGAQLVACNDDSGNDVCGLQSRVQFQLAPNSCYRVRIGGYSGQSGAGFLHARAFRTGDECFNAIDIGTVTASTSLNVLGYNAPATNMTVGVGVPQAPCTAFPDGIDLWYKFQIGCGGNVIGSVNTCDPSTDFDTIVTVYRGSCDGLILVGCNDDHFNNPACQLGGLFRKSLVDLPNAASAGYYYIRVSGYQAAWGNFRLRVGLSCIN